MHQDHHTVVVGKVLVIIRVVIQLVDPVPVPVISRCHLQGLAVSGAGADGLQAVLHSVGGEAAVCLVDKTISVIIIIVHLHAVDELYLRNALRLPLSLYNFFWPYSRIHYWVL